MKTQVSKKGHPATVAATVAPEDLRRADFIAVLTETIELPSFFWSDVVGTEREELVRLRCIPAGSGMPLKVKSICLPFVLVKTPTGKCEMLDVRKVQLVRLSRPHAITVWKELTR